MRGKFIGSCGRSAGGLKHIYDNAADFVQPQPDGISDAELLLENLKKTSKHHEGRILTTEFWQQHVSKRGVLIFWAATREATENLEEKRCSIYPVANE